MSGQSTNDAVWVYPTTVRQGTHSRGSLTHVDLLSLSFVTTIQSRRPEGGSRV